VLEAFAFPPEFEAVDSAADLDAEAEDKITGTGISTVTVGELSILTTE
jgi:hypothetical protein